MMDMGLQLTVTELQQTVMVLQQTVMVLQHVPAVEYSTFCTGTRKVKKKAKVKEAMVEEVEEGMAVTVEDMKPQHQAMEHLVIMHLVLVMVVHAETEDFSF